MQTRWVVLGLLLMVLTTPAFAGTVESGGGGLGGSSGGGGGDASLAEQQTQTSILTTIDADTGAISLGVGGTADAAATQGSTGSVSAKLRTVTSQLNTLDGRVDGVEGLLTTIDADTGNIATSTSTTATNTGTTATNTGTVAGAVDTTGTDRMRVTMYDSSGNEVVVPTAGLTSYTAAGASTNATNVKNAAGTVYGYSLTNTTTTIYYLRMYNLASAPTCSSSTGYVSTIPIPPAAAAGGAGGREITKNIRQAFTTGIGFCVTGGASSTDNTNAATGVFVEILYK